MKKAAVIGSTACLNGVYALCPIYADYDILIVNYLTNDMLAKSAAGLDTLITKALAAEKHVTVINEGVQYKKISNKAFFRMYDGYARKLKSFGVTFTDRIMRNHTTSKKLITAKDILSCISGEITVSGDTIVTPAAYDLAKDKNINITRNEFI